MFNNIDNKTQMYSYTHSALRIFQAISSAEGNLLISPYSLLNNMALVYAGSRGETKEQIANTLDFSLDPNLLNSFYGDYIKLINRTCLESENEVIFSHSLWPQIYTPFLSSFTRLARENYLADLVPLDFVRPEKARQTINDWADEKSGHKIQDLLPVGRLNDLIRMILIQLGHFNGYWVNQFNPANTHTTLFYTKIYERYDTPMMSQASEFNYYEDEEIQWIELPYQGFDFSMVIILPRKIEQLTQVENSLSPEKLNYWQNTARQTLVKLVLPRFKLTTNMHLCPTLRSLGMPLVFTPQADLSGMNGFNWHYISMCVHHATVVVDDCVNPPKTEVYQISTSEDQLITYYADHPFIFMIRETHSGGILFIGRYYIP